MCFWFMFQQFGCFPLASSIRQMKCTWPDGTNGDVGTSPNQILADKLNRFQSGGRLCPPQTLVPTNIFYIPAPLNVGRFSAFLWFHTYQNITLVQGQMRFWIGSTDMRLCPPQYNFCFEIPTIQFFRLCRHGMTSSLYILNFCFFEVSYPQLLSTI